MILLIDDKAFWSENLEKLERHMSKFIVAMDNSGGSAGVLDPHEQGWTDDDKMEKIHEFR